ncbi:hypothetical protein [Sporomusa termitida]|uniref:A9CJY8-like N-terminal domain-containing protein n=1 Tax=Sporomusa termitida TaxID=2377 RepID=A0A517E041_9FIRM|nr:hypothetical protein [Sporomusa termitida]QDR82969.1 hypothetical protein SPTER_44220 [Sporomusa termitida]
MNRNKLKFAVLPVQLGVCQLNSSQQIPQWAYQGEFFSITKTTEEISIVCPDPVIPPDTVLCERSWRALKITGVLTFS